MTDQTPEHPDGPDRSKVASFVRRAGSVLPSDPIRLKQGLGGIKDWTARLPSLLESPPWRTPLPNLTELSPGWRRHDRTHLEISLDHPAAADTGHTWEAWIFLPQSFRLDADTYSAQRIGSDIQSHVRLSAPELELGDVTREAGALARKIGTADPADAIDELKFRTFFVKKD